MAQELRVAQARTKGAGIRAKRVILNIINLLDNNLLLCCFWCQKNVFNKELSSIMAKFNTITEIKAYLEALPHERRSRLSSIVAKFEKLYPAATASMRYKMPTFEYEQGWVAVASQKHYISVYTCSAEHLEAFKAAQPKIKTGKGCINFKDSDDIPLDDLDSVIDSAMRFKH